MHTAMSTFFMTKELENYDGEKTASSTNVAWKSGYVPVEN
jgi:hypothetical protein